MSTHVDKDSLKHMAVTAACVAIGAAIGAGGTYCLI